MTSQFLSLQLDPGETFEHSCGLLFLYNGKYMVDISCFINDKFGKSTLCRERTFVMESATSRDRNRVPVNRRRHYSVPLSPKTVSSKLKTHEANFWGQTFTVNVK